MITLYLQALGLSPFIEWRTLPRPCLKAGLNEVGSSSHFINVKRCSFNLRENIHALRSRRYAWAGSTLLPASLTQIYYQVTTRITS